jgi:cardiolipin synthase
VFCLVLVDAIGGRPWLRSRQRRRLRQAGVKVRPALPVGLFRTVVGRTDLRLHRKIVVIDGESAWTGSMNLVDPRFFKQGKGFGEWVDAMVRLEGAVVAELAATVIWDWALETGESVYDLLEKTHLERIAPDGPATIQVIPSGPVETQDCMLQMLLTLINAAERELVLTTPYLVPDDAMTRAVRGAAGRGVRVTLIVPERVDSFLARHASRSYYGDLLDMGVEIRLYQDGLLHTKSIAVDGAMAMFGTVNFDYRSLWLNYEVALFVYDAEFTRQLGDLHQSYVRKSRRLDRATWNTRPFGRRLVENTLRLASPLL